MKTSTVVRLPYLAARAPLTVLDSQLVQRLRIDSWPRLTVERTLETLDAVTDRAFGTDRVSGEQWRKLAGIIDDTASGPVNPPRPGETVSTAQAAGHRASTQASDAGAQHLPATAATGKKYACVRAAAATGQTTDKVD